MMQATITPSGPSVGGLVCRRCGVSVVSPLRIPKTIAQFFRSAKRGLLDHEEEHNRKSFVSFSSHKQNSREK